jgi:hypothetical protein
LTSTPAGGVRGTTRSYRLCGLKFDSDFDLPALPQWDGLPDAPADVNCRLGEVPARLGRPDHIAPLFQTSGTGEYLLVLPGTARVLVRNGNEITVEPDTDPASSNLSAILTGTILAVLWHQRGLLPLHASVVVIKGRTLALCGDSAAGKSTLAAILARRGCGVIADDICVIDTRNNAEVLASPDRARLQLWHDALIELGVATNGLERALPQAERYFQDCGDRISAQPYALAAVVQVIRNAVPPARLERLRGVQAANALYNCVHSPRPARALGRAQPIFAALPRMASAGVEFWRLMVPEGMAGVRAAAAQLLAAPEG